MHAASLHIVRRYGPVGGMEGYVYQLTHALVRKGQAVTVLCEKNEATEYDSSLNIVELGNAYRKPRWRAQWGFSQRVSDYVEQYPPYQTIIHSHERTAVHHVTTFHGPPFLMRKQRVLDFLSPRIRMWTQLEKQELLGEQVRAILPNSPLIAKQLERLYPEIANKICEPAYPGVEPSFSTIQRQSSGLTIGFLGREWKRKGLDVACQVIEKLRTQISSVHFMVAGCDPDEIHHLFSDWPKGSYTLVGWTEPEYFLAKIDLLLHPAKAEPFGMVIAEANASGVPVVVSNLCGAAALVGNEQGQVCELAAPIDEWADACAEQLRRARPIVSMNLSWDALADQHIDLYSNLLETSL